VQHYFIYLPCFRECELGPIVNRDLSRRIRTVNGITVDKKVVRNDIKLAAKVITNLDTRWHLWTTGESNGDTEETDQVNYFNLLVGRSCVQLQSNILI
jgi:hypothetical protein